MSGPDLPLFEEFSMGSKANGQWTGTIKEGRGVMTPAHATGIDFSLGSRFEGKPSSNPEELLGAAIAGCFSMALTLALEHAGATPKQVQTSADVKLQKQGEGFAITAIALECTASAGGIDAAKFQTVAEETKKGCPVSKALSGTQISLTAKLI
jgi:osmotically inducible protein OsmC